jgi:membrane-associated phospholipid phosphatase
MRLFGLLSLCLASASFASPPASYLHPAADPAHDLTTREFLKDVTHNFGALVSRQNILPAAAGAALTGIATASEQNLERHFARGDIWGAWADPGTYVGNPLLLAGVSSTLFAASRNSKNARFRSASYSLVQGTIVTSAIVQSAKPMFQRLRPSGEDHSGFPSGHAADSFMFATVLTHHYGWKAGIPAYAVAAYVAASRLEQRKHHLTDITVGAAIGYIVGATVSRRMRGSKPSRFGWQVRPLRRGFAVSVQLAVP